MKRKIPHSVMFHHFHNETHLPAQGSICKNDFRQLILWLKKEYSLLGASEFENKFYSGNLADFDVCLSFDDALKCQYDVAIPILEEFKLNAYFFIYSSIFSNCPNLLEVFRLFRTSHFESIDSFYSLFFKIIKDIDKLKYLNEYNLFGDKEYLSEYPFYSDNDKWFRYLRDQYLDSYQYEEIMKTMMSDLNFNLDEAKRNLWMSKEEVRDINSKGHIIGLHSYSHPMRISKLNVGQQKKEYLQNYQDLSNIINKPIRVMSHPCGDYNEETLNILKDMGILIGFRSSMSIPKIKSSLEIPREDHSNVMREMI